MLRLALRNVCVANFINTTFRNTASVAKIPDDVLKKVLNSQEFQKYSENHLKTIVEAYLKAGFPANNIYQNHWIFEDDPETLGKKMDVVKKMKLRSWDEGVPFLKLPLDKLIRLVAKIIKEESSIPGGNRIYYISKLLKIKPAVVASHITERLFIFNMPFKQLVEKLEKLLECNMTPENIMQDLWVLNCEPDVIETRLKAFIDAGTEELRPWMVKCKPEIFEKTIKFRTEIKKLLSKNENTFKYISQRLDCSLEEVEKMAEKEVALNSLRITMAKEKLDFLSNNNFSTEEILNTPMIFSHSLKKLNSRLQELKSLGLYPCKLKVLCRSKKMYSQYVKCYTKQNSENLEDNQ